MDVVHGYLDRGVNISLIIIDFFSWNDPNGNINTLGDETLPKTCWPDPKGMVDDLKALGVELMVSPYSHSVSKTSTKYSAAAAQGLLAKNSTGGPALGYAGGYVYDLFNEKARNYAWGNMQAGCDFLCDAQSNFRVLTFTLGQVREPVRVTPLVA